MDIKSLTKKLKHFRDYITGDYKPKLSKREPITDIKPCPYCGRADHLLTKDNGPRFPEDRIAIFCDKCGFYYSDVDLKSCKKEWNVFSRTLEAQRLFHQMYK